MKDPIRIANSSGFFGDRETAMLEMAQEPNIDVITGDYLAEVTMLVLAKTRAKNPAGGYAASFPRQLRAALDPIAERGIRVVANAGGLNPHGLATVLTELIAEHGSDLTVAVVDGDDITGRIEALQAEGHQLPHLYTGQPLSTWKHTPLTANAYLGGWGICEALKAGADIVVTGRVTDASVVTGAAAWWHDWQRTDFDQLAGAVVAGHIIECGTQTTGGNYSDFAELMPIGVPSFPIAEIAADGSSVITKAAGGGAVTVGTVTAQLMYEIDTPGYLNPDVVAHFDTIELDPIATDRVRVHSVTGTPPPETTKVSITALGGYRNYHTAVITGLDADAKIAWLESAITDALQAVPGVDSIVFERLGSISPDAPDQASASMLVRCAVTGDEQAVGRRFGATIVELALANIPGFYGTSLPGAAQSFGTYWPGVIDQSVLHHRVTFADGSAVDIAPTPGVADAAAPTATEALTTPPLSPPPGGGTVPAPLGMLVDARSGDKGGDANVGLWVRDLAHWTWLRDLLTVDMFRSLVPESAGLDVDRYEFANLGAINFVVRGLLGEGATANTRFDKQAKALGEYIRARHVQIPIAFLDDATVAGSAAGGRRPEPVS